VVDSRWCSTTKTGGEEQGEAPGRDGGSGTGRGREEECEFLIFGTLGLLFNLCCFS